MRFSASATLTLLGGCVPPTAERILPEVGAACESALKSLPQSKGIEGKMLVSYETKYGRQYMHTWPKNTSSGNVDAVCVADIYNRKITKMMVDVTSKDGVEVRKDFLPLIQQELRTF